MTATLLDSYDTLTVEVNGTGIQNGSAATWTEGENTVDITVHDSYTGDDIEYEVTVTYTPSEE